MLKVSPMMFAFKNKKLVVEVGKTYGRVDFQSYPPKISTKHFVVEAYEPNSLTIKHIGKHPGRVVNMAAGGITADVNTGSTVVLTPDDAYYPVNYPDFQLRVKLDSVKVKVERAEKAFSIDEIRYFIVNGVIHSARREDRKNMMFMAKCFRDVPFTEEELNELVIDEWEGSPQDYLNMLNDEILEKELGLRKQDVKMMIMNRDECENVNKAIESKELKDFYDTPDGRVELTPAMQEFRRLDEERILNQLSAAILFKFTGLKDPEDEKEEAEDAEGENIEDGNDDEEVEEAETLADKSFVSRNDQLVYYKKQDTTEEHGEMTNPYVLIEKKFNGNEVEEKILDKDWDSFDDEESDPGSPVLTAKRACRQPSPKPETTCPNAELDDDDWGDD